METSDSNIIFPFFSVLDCGIRMTGPSRPRPLLSWRLLWPFLSLTKSSCKLSGSILVVEYRICGEVVTLFRVLHPLSKGTQSPWEGIAFPPGPSARWQTCGYDHEIKTAFGPRLEMMQFGLKLHLETILKKMCINHFSNSTLTNTNFHSHSSPPVLQVDTHAIRNRMI